MKILVFSARDITHPWAGGAELNIHEMAKRWADKGYQVVMFCAQHYGDSKTLSEEEIDGIRILRKGGRYTVYLWALLFYFFKLRHWADVIVDIEYGVPFFTPLFSSKPRVCLLHHIHGPMYFTETPFPLNYIGFFVATVLMPRIYRKTCFVAVSQDSKKNLISLGIDPDSIEVVYNGVDKEKYTPGNQKSSIPTILYLGRIRFYKRIDILIDLLPKIAERVLEVRLLIAGTGIARTGLEKEARNRGLEERIKFLGSVSEKERVKLLQGSWVYVTPSLVEGWGLGVIEANACGTPAVAFKIPGLSEAIESGKFGYLVSNREEMLEKIVKILTNKKLRDELSVGARIRASQFDWDKSARRFLQILERIKNNG